VLDHLWNPLHATPVIVANVIVAGLALYSAWLPGPQNVVETANSSDVVGEARLPTLK